MPGWVGLAVLLRSVWTPDRKAAGSGRKATGQGRGATFSVHRFLWDGDVLAAEYRVADDQEDKRSFVWWHFEPNSFVPMLRVDIDSSGEQRILHVVTDHLGAPRELVKPSGEIVWSSSYRLWGGVRGLWTAANDNRGAVSGGFVSQGFRSVQASLVSVVDAAPVGDEQPGINAHAAVIDAELCPIRFLGQWEDAETGLCYNRFRTYDPSTGQYLSADPIGLLGGCAPMVMSRFRHGGRIHSAFMAYMFSRCSPGNGVMWARVSQRAWQNQCAIEPGRARESKVVTDAPAVFIPIPMQMRRRQV